uniref:Uncharacterized protein n=1 Tax=Anguilla anguilla TaxID=7936 RepID=A0A0E9T5F5_ANGAN
MQQWSCVEVSPPLPPFQPSLFLFF